MNGVGWRRAVWALLFLGFFLRDGVATSAHRIRPGDTLRIVVLNRPEYSQEVVVQEDGKLGYFLIEEIDVAGMTPEELRDRLREALSEYLEDPQVLVVPTLRPNEVYVGGRVKEPGRYAFAEDAIDLRRALILAGGPLDEGADLRRVYHLRKEAPPTVYDLTSPDAGAVRVDRGDVVYVPKRTKILVTGNVAIPGAHWVDGPISVALALARAGGVLDDKGSLERLVLLRADGTIETIRVEEAFWEDAGSLPTMGDGDTLYVANAYRVEEVSVLGYVQNPGLYRVRGPIPVGRAIGLAGGLLTEVAKTDEVEIQRLDGTREVIDLNAQATTALVYPGETVRVDKRFRINWTTIYSFISTAILVVSLVRR